MNLESKRIFISDLPETATEDEIRKKFNCFGEITGIEIKERKSLGARNTSYMFAFVNINIAHDQLQKCFDDFANTEWKNTYVNIQLAKESFLEKLKRERQDTNNVGAQNPSLEKETTEQEKSNVTNVKAKNEVITNGRGSTKKQNFVKEVTESSDSSDDQEEEIEKKCKTPKNVTKTNEIEADYSEIVVKNNKHKTKNGKIKIESVGNAPIIISGQNKRKSKDPYREKADQKRLNSMYEMKKGHEQQQSMIKMALSNPDQQKQKKIVFDRDEETPMESTQEKPTLFSDNDEEDEENYDFASKKQFDGKGGEKLLQLQSRYNSDKRFQLDERFAENDAEETEKQTNENALEETNEHAKDLQILGEVLGKTFDEKPKKQKKQMLRFDPNQPDHSKYEIKPDEHQTKKKKSKKEKKAAEQEKVPEVSQETFFNVTTDLKEALKEKEAFSLLSMFGKTDEPMESKEEEQIEISDEKPKKTSGKRFKYDSSDDDEEQEEKRKKPEEKPTINEEIVKPRENIVNLGPEKLWTESFFFKKDDYRFQEGSDFIKRAKMKAPEKDFKDLRQNLKQIVKSKMKNNERRSTQFKKKVAIKRKKSKGFKQKGQRR